MNLLRTSSVVCAAACFFLVCVSTTHAQDIPLPESPPQVNAQDFNNPNLPPVSPTPTPVNAQGGVTPQNLGQTPSPQTPQNLGQTPPAAPCGGSLCNPLGANGTLPGLLTSILAFVVRLGTFVVIFMLVYVGYLFVVARGVPAKISEAKNALLWTVVGALILLGAQAIAAGIQATVQSIGAGNTITANPNTLPVPTASANGQVVY